VTKKLKRNGRNDLRKGRKIERTTIGFQYSVFSSSFQEKRIGNGKKKKARITNPRFLIGIELFLLIFYSFTSFFTHP